MRHIGGQGLPTEAIGVVDRSRHDQPPDRPQDRQHEHEKPKLGMNPKRLDLLAADGDAAHVPAPEKLEQDQRRHRRSEEHTSELQSLMRISYAVFCLKKKKKDDNNKIKQSNQPHKNRHNTNNKTKDMTDLTK